MNYCESKKILFLQLRVIFWPKWKKSASFNCKADVKIYFLKYIFTSIHTYRVCVFVIWIEEMRHREEERNARESDSQSKNR